MCSFETVELSGLLLEASSEAGASSMPDGVAVVETLRQREGALRRLLPDKIIRRLDRGFARSATVHPDTGQALYAICRAWRPDVVFETGTYWGYSTAFLAAAVRDNGVGKLHTFDLDSHAGRHFPRSLNAYAEFHRGRPSTESMPPILEQGAPQLFFQDSRHDYEGVLQELQIVAPRMNRGAVVLFHDFSAPDVRRAARDGLLSHGFSVRLLQSGDPQEIGVAVKTA